MKLHALHPEFVKSVPETLQPGVLYISMQYATAIHLCACGCAEEVVTPISPRGWQLEYDGESISLKPSIGNWRLPCRSHYWIRRSRINWAADSGQPPSPAVAEAAERAAPVSSLVQQVVARVRRWWRGE